MKREYSSLLRSVITGIAVLVSVSSGEVQFLDRFENSPLAFDTTAAKGWAYFTGDGQATMKFFSRGNGIASIIVDATRDKDNVWWALIKRHVSADMNLDLLCDPRYALRVEARIRVSDAPKRVNLHVNTQRTTDFHSHLMEYDIPDTTEWHTISMTTQGFRAAGGDTVFAQLALMDWGLKRYRVDLHYFKVDIVRVDTNQPDLGDPIPYHPPVPVLAALNTHLPVAHDCTIDIDHPSQNFNRWMAKDSVGLVPLLAVDERRFVILRWDCGMISRKKATGSGVLEFTTFSLKQNAEPTRDVGLVRIVEILGGTAAWNEETVTLQSLADGFPLSEVLNSQMIIDISVAERRGQKNFAVIPHVVLQRLLEGRTLGLAILPLGGVQADFFAREYLPHEVAPTLHLNLE